MSVTVEVLFAKPQQEIASRLRTEIDRCLSVSMVSGFATAEGIEQVAHPLGRDPSKLSCLVVGAGTFRAFEALDGLLDAGVAPSNLFVHLGHEQADLQQEQPIRALSADASQQGLSPRYGSRRSVRLCRVPQSYRLRDARA